MTEQNPHPNSAAAQSAGREPTSFAARHEWTLVGILAVLTFLLGCIGYSQIMTFAADGGEHSRWDVAYASLQLFIFEAPDATAGWPIHLQVARALAPLIVL